MGRRWHPTAAMFHVAAARHRNKIVGQDVAAVRAGCGGWSSLGVYLLASCCRVAHRRGLRISHEVETSLMSFLGRAQLDRVAFSACQTQSHMSRPRALHSRHQATHASLSSSATPRSTTAYYMMRPPYIVIALVNVCASKRVSGFAGECSLMWPACTTTWSPMTHSP